MTFLCTGGYGQHFNTTNRPHAYYAKQALIKKGVREEDFLPFILSTNTYEDFKISKEIIEKELPDMLIVITSDFQSEELNYCMTELSTILYPILACQIESF